MSKKPLFLVPMTVLLLMVLTVGFSPSVQAQSPTETLAPVATSTLFPNSNPTVTPEVVSSLTPIGVQSADSSLVTFSQLSPSEIQLTGPFDQRSFSFALPASWSLKDGAELDLSLGISFNTALNQSDIVVVGGGTLRVSLNGVVLVALPLNEVGEVRRSIPIPLSAFTSTRADGRMELDFVLDSGFSCRINGENTIVFIRQISSFTLPHNSIVPSVSLVNFPRPIFQDTFIPDSAMLVLPDQPSAAELQAALTTAAGLGRLGRSKLLLDMTTLSRFNAQDAASKHLIFIGKAASLPILKDISLPLPVSNNQISIPEGGADDGIVEMVVSPWSNSHAVLVISSNTDAGIVKAAQAVSTGILRPNRAENVAVIQQVNTVLLSTPQAVDRTLADLGYQGALFEDRGVDEDEYLFTVPPGMTLSLDAYFTLIYGNSALIDYNSSSIVIILNDQPIGSVRMSDATASVPTNSAKFLIPPTAVVSGSNVLSVRVNIVPVDNCTPPSGQSLWVNIWPQSLLHLPLTSASVDPVAPLDLATYPVPFIYDPVLSTTAFILEREDIDSWRNAVKIAANLGYSADGSITQLTAFYGDDVPVVERSKYHLLVIGRPSRLSIVAEMNDRLPAPFTSGSDSAMENNLQVTFRVPSDSPMGYVETMRSPWNPNNVVLGALGNTTQGVNWAAVSLVDPTLRPRLGGNFAVVYNRQIVSTNTNLGVATGAEFVATQVPAAVVPAAEVPEQTAPSRPIWIIPALGLSVGLIVLIISIVFIRNQSLNRTRKRKEKNDVADHSADTD